MRVRVEEHWRWGEKTYYRLTWQQCGETVRERINADTWNRATATAALDMLERVYGLRPRRMIRFDHH